MVGVYWDSSLGTFWLSSKILNRMVRMRNGNRTSNTNLSVIHWNGGAKRWENKLLEIECLLRSKDPDLCFISEANLWDDVDTVDRDIQAINFTCQIP